MSSIANWSYQLIATVWPFQGYDDFTGVESYGLPYKIKCDVSGKSEIRTDADGAEFVTKNIFWTECASSETGVIGTVPRRKDRIAIGDVASMTTAEEIKVVLYQPTDSLGDPVPDYEINT